MPDYYIIMVDNLCPQVTLSHYFQKNVCARLLCIKVALQRKKFKQFEFWRQNSLLLFVVENKQPIIRQSFGATIQTV